MRIRDLLHAYYFEIIRRAFSDTFWFFYSKKSFSAILFFAFGLVIHWQRVGLEAALQALDEWLSFGLYAAIAYVGVVLFVNALMAPVRINREVKEERNHLKEDRDAYRDKLGAALEKSNQCPEAWLHIVADFDKNDLNKAIIFDDKGAHTFESDDKHYIQFQFSVFNGSVFTLSVDTVTGYVVFTDYESKNFVIGQPYMATNLRNLRHAQRRDLVLHTPIQPKQIREIEASLETTGGNFTFDEVKVWITCHELDGKKAKHPLSLPLMSAHKLARKG